jgi:membrane fusion protein (multidrug efflux system)
MSKLKSLFRSSSFFSLALASVLIASSPGCSKKQDESGTAAGASPKKAPEETATRVELAILEGGTSASRFVRPGEVIGAREANLAAALGGYVERVLVESGQQVTKGQVIARVDTSTHAAQLALVKVEVEDAARELERLTKMGKAVARARVDAAKTRVARAQAQKRVAMNAMSRATIKAPFAGVLVDLQIEQGEVAAPGQPIGRLLVLDPIAVSVSVTDQDVHSLTLGGPVKISTAGSSTPIAGSISRIEPAADMRTRTFLVEVEAANPERKLLPGMIASVSFQPAEIGDALLLPQDLLVTNLKSNGVFVVGEDLTARWKPLELGSIVGSQVEVKSGVSRGERIVTVGMRSLSDGDKVLVGREGVCCTNGSVVFTTTTAKPKATATTPKAMAPVDADAAKQGTASK